jgi:hypothetical protein
MRSAPKGIASCRLLTQGMQKKCCNMLPVMACMQAFNYPKRCKVVSHTLTFLVEDYDLKVRLSCALDKKK